MHGAVVLQVMARCVCLCAVAKVKGMVHLNPAEKGLLMPPDCIKSGILDEDNSAPVGLDICKNSNKLMAEPGPLQMDSMHSTCATACDNSDV